jgi:hypothetical protein
MERVSSCMDTKHFLTVNYAKLFLKNNWSSLEQPLAIHNYLIFADFILVSIFLALIVKT